MKKTSRLKITKITLVLAVMVLIMSVLSACTAGESVTSRYDLDVVDATPNFYVNDFAGIFSEEQINSLMEKAVSFDEESSGIQVVITTVKSLNDAVVDYELIVEDQDGNRVEGNQTDATNDPKFTVEEVAYSMYKEYGIGKDDMGILILLSTGTGNGDGDIRIETGRQMQFYITDGLSGELLDNYAMEYLYEQQYAEGLISLQSAVIDEIRKQVPTDWHSQVAATDETKVDSETTEEATGIVAGEAGDNSGSDDAAGKDNSETNDSGKGILWGFFGSILAAIAALVAFIKQKFKGDTERQKLEEAKVAEINSLKEDFNAELARRDSLHEQEVQCQKRNYQSLRKEKDREISRLEKNLKQANGEISTLTKELEVMTDKYERAQRLHP